ncbi:thioredoxin family protein [Archaeoglobus neptunius]|uniref:thioredoxin family protein n=1 Tax=Archaeoglobus neptunius TaxID=2798580 RepID=UPI0019293EAA|nr:thioredoxin family protein [Archaeoglobus neptunius]
MPEKSVKVFQSKEMLEFVRKLNISCEFVKEPEPCLGLPAIKLNRSNIYFHAIPEHSELQSFLFAIRFVSENETKPDVEVHVITFVSKFCPNCRATVDAVNGLTAKYGIEHHIIDASLFSGLAEKYEVMSVPTAIINSMRFVGAMGKNEVEKWIKAAIDGDYRDYIVEKLMNGDIEDVKRLAMSRNIGRELGELVGHREFMVRLGAMAAIESLHEENPEITKAAKEEITKLLTHEDERMREDAAMMLGIIGNEDDIKYLEELVGEGGRVGDSAGEAIDSIRGRKNG